MSTEAARRLFEYQKTLDLEPSSWWTLEECEAAVGRARAPFDPEWLKLMVQAMMVGCFGLAVTLAAIATLAWEHQVNGVITTSFALFLTLMSVVTLAHKLGSLRGKD